MNRVICGAVAVMLLAGRGAAGAETRASVSILSLATYVDSVSKARWASCISFRNDSTRPVRAVQFVFTYYDAFDEAIQTFTADRVGEFAPGVAIEGRSSESLLGGENCWSIFGTVPSLSKVSAEVAKVRYGDTGEVWVVPSPREKFFSANLSNIDTNHPASIVCNGGIAKIRYNWNYAHQVPICQKAIRDWEQAHAFGAPSSPAPANSPTP